VVIDKGMAKFGAHYNQLVRFSSAVECEKGPQFLTSLKDKIIITSSPADSRPRALSLYYRPLLSDRDPICSPTQFLIHFYSQQLMSGDYLTCNPKISNEIG